MGSQEFVTPLDRGLQLANGLALELMPVGAAQSLMEEEETSDIVFYLPGHPGKEPVLYRNEGFGLSRPDFARLREGGVSALFVRTGDVDRCEQILEGRLRDLLRDPNVAPEQKAACVQYVGTSVADALVSGPSQSANIDRASHLLDTVIESLLGEPSVAAELMQMAGHHQTTASHMFTVSILSVMLGAEVFGKNKACLKEVGLAGMLHDLGKMAVPPQILDKTQPLDTEEIQLMHQHPIESVLLIGDSPHVTMAARQMILQHHERVDGNGYPLGLTVAEMLPGSKVLALADSFHAMIGRRAYRNSLTYGEANRALATQVGRQFDADVFAAWENLSEQYWRQFPSSWATNMPQVSEAALARNNEHRRLSRPKSTQARKPRRECQGRVDVECVYAGRLENANPAPDEFTSPLHDISRSGLCMYTLVPMYRGEVVHVLISTGGEMIWVRGTVAWCRRQADDGRYRTGVQFLQRISPEEARQRVTIRSRQANGTERPYQPDILR